MVDPVPGGSGTCRAAAPSNKEDGCKGRFWEGRFKSQALLDEKALMACMAYVDLNPIRAGLCETLEGSDYTSIQERIGAHTQAPDDDQATAEVSLCRADATSVPVAEQGLRQDKGAPTVPAAPLVAFVGTSESSGLGLPFHFSDYLELVDWTGRAIRSDKRGYIPADIPPVLTRLGWEADNWIETVQHFRRHFYDFVGPADVLAQCSQALGRSWLRGVGACRKLLGKTAPQAAVFS